MMNNTVPFNVNNHVWVQLTDLGRAHYESYWFRYLKGKSKLAVVEEDENGWSRWQLHELMAVYGELMAASGMRVPFATEIRFEVEPLLQGEKTKGLVELEQKLVFATNQTERALAIATTAEAKLSAAQAEIAELKEAIRETCENSEAAFKGLTALNAAAYILGRVQHLARIASEGTE